MDSIYELTDKEIFFELMKRCNIHPKKLNLENGKLQSYNVSDAEHIVCYFKFDNAGKYFGIDVYD